MSLANDLKDARWDLVNADIKELEEELEFRHREHSSFYHKLDERLKELEAILANNGSMNLLIKLHRRIWEDHALRIKIIEAGCNHCLKEGKD